MISVVSNAAAALRRWGRWPTGWSGARHPAGDHSAITARCFARRITASLIRHYVPLVAVGAGLRLLSLTAGSGSSSPTASGGAGTTTGGGACDAPRAASAVSAGSSGMRGLPLGIGR